MIQLVTSSLVSLGFTGFLVFLVKNYLSEKIKGQLTHEYGLKLASYKDELGRQSNSELEELKASLKISEIKSNIQISHLHEKQADSIFTIHRYMRELFASLGAYTTIAQARTNDEKEIKRHKVADDLKELRVYYELHSYPL
jgi:hypothetical protein